MNTENLRQIFKSPFDYKTYSNEIVHRLFGCNDVVSRPELLDTNAEGDQSFFIGQMDDTDHRLLGFFYTRVADGGDVRRKRVGLRKLISPYLKYDVDGAIAVFDDGRHWRLSYICDLKEGSTSAKRFSYILGDENGQYKTPLERLEKVAKLNGRLKLSDIKESFSVDALSDEFFDEYHIHYDRIVAELARQGKTGAIHHDYVKKMMGRIVFLHFLQKKGWLNGNPTFLRDLFCHSPHQADFLEQVLEPLFFGIFNTESEQREKLFANEHWDKELLKQWEQLPYLNGGLFERDEIDKMNIRLPASLFDNLFTFLASYNFTVDENDPDDAEIGVDPEMLGKIFESLLEDNKAKGAFYTPKEIVRYMCKESLIAYLSEQCTMNNVQCNDAVRSFVENHEFPKELKPHWDILDKALREVKICDPAIGSGAFPMGLLNELWRCREAIGTPLSRLQLKKEIIENNIYGVDIERGAIDIARLRFWLSIVVDSEEPQALPNFDYKFMQGNSLIESFEGVDLSRMMDQDGMMSGLGKGKSKAGANQLGIEFVSEDTKRNLQLMLREYFSITDHVKKAEMRQSINDSVKSYIRQLGISPRAEIRLSTLDPSANQEFFLWHTWFKDIFDGGGFDIVIGNPPYIRRTELPESAKLQYERTYKSATLQYDIYLLFIEFGLSICKKEGQLCYINPIRFFSSDYGQSCRTLIIKDHLLKRVVDVSQIEVFKSAMTYPCVLHIQNRKEADYSIEFYAPECLQVIDNVTKGPCKLLQKKNVLDDPEHRIIVSENHNLIRKIDQNSKPVETWFKVSRGLPNNKVDFMGDNYYALKSTMVKKYRITDAYKLIDTDFSDAFRDEMIILPRTVLFLQATMKEKNIVLLDRIYYLTQKAPVNTRFVLGVINSKVTNFWFEHYYGTTKVSGGYFDLNGTQIKSIPIPNATTKQQNAILSLVETILKMKKQDISTDTSDLEREIDGLVYRLYGLTEEEIAKIEKER
ncbi:MAG: Eco57I restriction-modification methylase domain-containing protein [Bacteroidales bacterium]|nr:Eco57I restriction-modification methylase domain-containing protein [Bacteroidales bacterium]